MKKLKIYLLRSIVVIAIFSGLSVISVGQNVAQGKPTRQSSQFNPNQGQANLAVDGITDGSFSVGSVTHTADEGTTDPWWEVDLGQVYELNGINVYNRTDCCVERLSGFKILGRSSEGEAWKTIYSGPPIERKERFPHTKLGRPYFSDPNALPQARFVRIQLAGPGRILSLAEVEVFGSEPGDMAKTESGMESCTGPNGTLRYSEPLGEGKAILFTQANYRGECIEFTYEEGNYPYSIATEFNERGYFRLGNNKTFYSMKLGSGIEVTVCTDKFLKGTCKKYTKDAPYLGAQELGSEINSFKMYTLNPKNYVQPGTPTATQVRVCNKDKGNTTGCLMFGIGDQVFQGREFNQIEVGADVKAQIYPEPNWYGTSTLYPGGVNQKTSRFKSMRVLAKEDTLRADRKIYTPTPRPIPLTPVAKVEPSVVPTEKSSNTTSGAIPVVMPASNSTLSLVNFPLSQNPIDQAYIRPEQESNLDDGYGSPEVRSSIRSEYYDFALNTQGELFYMKSKYASYNFSSDRDVRRLNVSSPSKLVKIGGTDRSLYRQDGKQRYNTNLYALTEDGRIVTASFDSSSNPPNQISFSISDGNNRFSDVFYQDSWGRLLALTTDSRLFSYSRGKWTELAKTNFVKFAVDDFNPKIFGLTANNELFVADKDGKGGVKILDDVKDFSVTRGALLYHISSKTNLLMKSMIGETDGKVIDTKKADEKGTFVKFITNTVCVVKNGNGQVFICK